MKTFFCNSTPVMGPGTESSTQKPGHPTNSRQWHHRKREREREEEEEEETYTPKSYKAKLE
jgi:hypothetical protein